MQNLQMVLASRQREVVAEAAAKKAQLEKGSFGDEQPSIAAKMAEQRAVWPRTRLLGVSRAS